MAIKIDSKNVRNHPDANKKAIRASLDGLGTGRVLSLTRSKYRPNA